jgi:hypothetical protein
MTRFLSIGVVVMVVALAVGCRDSATTLWPAPPASGDNYHPQVIPPYVGTGRSVALAGDSITMLSGGVQAPAFQAAGFSQSITGNLGYTLATMKPWIDLYSDSRPAVMLVNLGTNDTGQQVAGNHDYSLDLFKRRVDYYRTRFPGSCLVFTTITTHRTAVEGDPAKAPVWNGIAQSYNDYLRSGGRVADWDQVLAGHPEYTADEVHPSDSGSAALSALMVAAAESCVPAPAGASRP